MAERARRARAGRRATAAGFGSGARRRSHREATTARCSVCRGRDDVRREREVAAYAQIAAAATRANGGRAAVALPPDLARDPRLRGLFAFVVGDTRACEREWQTLTSLPGSPDPLVDAALGHMHLQAGMSGKAYARLVLALAAWPADGALAIATAESALLVHDSAQAGRYLQVAEGAGRSGVVGAGARRAARRDGARRRAGGAGRSGVRWSTDLAAQNLARIRYVRFLMTRQKHEHALDPPFDLVLRAPHGLDLVPALWDCARGWRAHLPPEGRVLEVLQA